MKRTLTISAIIALAAATQSALAADIPRREMPVKAPVYAPAPPFSWTGFYVGINGGGAWGRSDFDFAGARTGGFDVSGGLVGGTIGYNYQTGPFVLGIEGDINWTSIRGSTPCLVGAFSCETKNDWLGTARGRIGYAFDRFMPYVTGGLAVGNIKADIPGLGSGSDTKAGWTVGGGLEYALYGNWTVKAEYLRVDLGTFDCGLACGVVTPTNVKFDTNIVRAGVNFRF